MRVKFELLTLVVSCVMKLHNVCMDELDTALQQGPEEEGQQGGVRNCERPQFVGGVPVGMQRNDGGGAANTDMAVVRDRLIQLMSDLRMPRPLVRRFDDA